MARRVAPTVFLAGVSPVTVALVAGVVALVLITTGSIVGAVVAGIATWVLRVFVSTRVAKRIEALPRRIDPFALREPWRFFVRDAISARNRFADALDAADDGPLRDRLVEIGEALNHGVEECWEAAQKGQQLTDARRRIPADRLQAQLADMTADDPRRSGVEAQLESHARLADREERTRVELERLDVRLDESVVRASELGTRAGGAEDLDAIEASITDVVGSLEALRQGLDDVEGTA
ncbi:MAG: hypothetical protein AAGA90_23410 [Actinomycetota bacterium]